MGENKQEMPKEYTELFEEIAKAISDKEKYKLALFICIRNNTVLPKGMLLGKTEQEINKMAYEVMQIILRDIDYDKAKKTYEEASNL